LTLIWGMMNVLNFAHGEFVTLGMFTAFLAFSFWHTGPLVFIPLAAIVLFVIGQVVYYALIRDVMRGPMFAQVLATFGLLLFIRYMLFWIFSPNYRTLPSTLLGGTAHIDGLYVSYPKLIAALVAIALTAAVYYLLVRTQIGSQMLAVAEDREAARLMGIDPDRVQALAWGISAACAGVAGALLATFYYISPDVGGTFVLFAFVAVTLGGFGSVPGAMLAGPIIGVVQVATGYYTSPQFAEIAVFTLFILVLWLRPQGLLGRSIGGT
jgi:branched-chain amino acid transport system permease protein